MNITAVRQIEILIADDHPLLRKSLKIVISQTKSFKLVGEVENGRQLIEAAIKLKPDIIITDIMMPVLDGIEATRQIIKELPGVGIIALSMVDDGQLLIDMLEAGAKGYLSKDVFAEELVNAVNAVSKNGTYYSKTIQANVTDLVAKGEYRIYKKIKDQFSENELSVIRLICEEYSTKEIADKLHITKRTVDGLREIILKKMKVKNIAGIVRYAIDYKLYISTVSSK